MLRIQRGRRDDALAAWSALATARGLRLFEAPGLVGTQLSGRWGGRPLTVSVREGGGLGAEQEVVTEIRLQLCGPVDPALAMWRVGQQPPAPGGTRLGDRLLMAAGDTAPIGAALAAFEAAVRRQPALHLRGGWLRLQVWGLHRDIEARIYELAELAVHIEEAACAPWLVAAAPLGMVAQAGPGRLTLRAERSAGATTIEITGDEVRLRIAQPLPGVRCIGRRRGEQVTVPVRNPIVDRFLSVDASEAVRVKLAQPEATALLMEVIWSSPEATVSEAGMALVLPIGSADTLGVRVSSAEALSAILRGDL